MSTRRISATALTVLLLAGCAGNTGTSDSGVGSGSPRPELSTAASPTADRDGTALIHPSDKPTEPGESRVAKQTITGTVSAGVEPGCLMLQSGGVSYQLLLNAVDKAAAATVGATITVTGEVKEGMVTTCQQGTPFMVSEVRSG